MVNPAAEVTADCIRAAQRQLLRPENVIDGNPDQVYMFLWPHQMKAALAAGLIEKQGDDLVLNLEHEPRAIICALTKIPASQ